MATSPLKDFLVTYLMPEKCYERIVVNFHLNGPCLKFILNRIAGLCIILDIFLAQLPQLLKILWRGSADGLSLTASLLQLYAFSCPVVYAMAHNFPLFAWAERLITLTQAAAIIFLILRYRGETFKGMLFLLAYSGVMFLLGSYTVKAVASVLQASSLTALIASKGFQAGTNYKNGHTGQLSTLSVSLSWTGSLGVLSVSLQDTGSSLETLSHALSACLSCALLAQVLCYRSSTASTKKKSE
ncbi:mannose-P-dolichol utilization defect 1 protein-like [Notolabrus celidotus]|uniref:mannose-P-dolichol utilization defect 1 protein-like n=1 Tax=Notolabrus celidotus TaxID=1203425 RepID=UPI0014905D7D|nr:mannose-P-dolichol utilization defect 1 protein-like [Notolabrus celidotus]